MSEKAPNKITVGIALVAILLISLFIQKEFSLKQSMLFLMGVGFGVILLHASFGFTGGWRQLILKRNTEGVRAQLALLALTSILFFPLIGGVIPELRTSAAVAPLGYSVVIGAFLFGIGMQLGGGCGSGTLYTFGQGQVDMLITLTFFIIGATTGSAHLHWWYALGDLGSYSIIQHMGWPLALLTQLIALGILYILVTRLSKASSNTESTKPVAAVLRNRVLFGPWSLWLGVIGLAVFNLLTLLTAGHPWSITFAFSLWGTKLWSALGGNVANWPYWSSGYPAQALQQSVLADVTSLMDIGLILGAMLAAALAGKYAPAMTLKPKRVVTAVIGGLLLGYGARLAFGCNIGALLAGISSGSLHGWLWLIAAFMGSIIGVRIRIMLGFDHPVQK